MTKRSYQEDGYLMIQALVFGAIAIIIVSGLIAFALANVRLGRRIVRSEQAFQMAEAGLEYYRWHLAHAPADYTDGTGQPGPYVKNFYDRNGVLLGTFTLSITAPPLGSTLVTIQSVGTSAEDVNVKRTILSKLAIPSFANFAAVTDAMNRFGSGTEVFGPIHSNSGLRFDGLAHNLVTSFVSTYNDPDHSGNNEFGVHTHVNAPPGSGINESFRSLEAPPNAVQARPDVFIAGRSFPSPKVEFNDITTNLQDMYTEANANGLYFASSTDEGYRIVLKANDTFDLYRVDTLQAPPGSCSNTQSQSGWSSWSVNASILLGNYPFPADGLIFLDDHVWVEGTIDGARITIVAAHIPDNDVNKRRSMNINNDITYTHYDGTDSIALIGQNNVNVGLFSENDLRMDAALVAQVGRVGRYYYSSSCSPNNIRSVLTLYGTLISAQRYGFAYSSGSSGYITRNLIYDSFLLYTPPPFFPKIEDFHKVISWKEIE